MFNRKENARLSLLKLNKSIVNDEEKIAISEISKSMKIFYPGDQIWLQNYRRDKKPIKSTIISKAGPVTYKVKCCNEIYEKQIDQLPSYPNIETELEVKDTSQSEQNLLLHPIPHSIEPDQSNLAIMSPTSNNTLSDKPTSTSSSQSTDTPVPIKPNIDTSTQQSNTSPCLTKNRPKRNC